MWHWLILDSSPGCCDLRLHDIMMNRLLFNLETQYSFLSGQWPGDLYHFQYLLCYKQVFNFPGSRCYLFIIYRMDARVFLFDISGYLDENCRHGWMCSEIFTTAVVFYFKYYYVTVLLRTLFTVFPLSKDKCKMIYHCMQGLLKSNHWCGLTVTSLWTLSPACTVLCLYRTLPIWLSMSSWACNLQLP